MATFDLNYNNSSTVNPADINLKRAAAINTKTITALGSQVVGGGAGLFKSIAHSIEQHAVKNKGGYVDNLISLENGKHYRNAEKSVYEAAEDVKDFFNISTDEDIGTKGKTNGYTNNK